MHLLCRLLISCSRNRQGGHRLWQLWLLAWHCMAFSEHGPDPTPMPQSSYS